MKDDNASTAHNMVSSLVTELKEYISILSTDQNIRNNSKFTFSKILESLIIRDNLMKLKGSENTAKILPAFDKVIKNLKTLPLTSHYYKALSNAITENQNIYKIIQQQEDDLVTEIQNSKEMIEHHQKKIPLALANAEYGQLQQLEGEVKILSDIIDKNEMKLNSLNNSTRYIIDSLLYSLNSVEQVFLKNYRKKRATEQLAVYEQAKAEFLKACEKIKGYDGTDLVLNEGVLLKELLKDIAKIPSGDINVKAELLRAA